MIIFTTIFKLRNRSFASFEKRISEIPNRKEKKIFFISEIFEQLGFFL